MSKPANDHHPLILSSEIIALSTEPLVGEITLTTDKGDFVLAISQEQAGALLDELAVFLDTE
jgi:hypothetical protein